MTTDAKTHIIAALGDACLILTIISTVPYEIGSAGDILPPKIKAGMLIGAGAATVLLKTAQRAIQIISAWTGPASPPLTQEQVAQVAEQVMNAPLPAVQTVRLTVPQSPFAPTAKSVILPDQKP